MDQNFIFNPTFLVRDCNGYFYFIYFDIENETVEIDKDHPYLTYLRELESSSSSSLNNESTSENLYSWDNYLNSRIHSYLQSKIYMDTSIVSDSSDSDLQYPIDLDTSETDSSDSDLQYLIEIDTSDTDSSDSDLPYLSEIDMEDTDSSDSDLPYLSEIDTEDSSDSDLQYPIYIDMSNSDLPSPIDFDLDAAMASIRDKLERYRQSTGTSIVSDSSDSDFKDLKAEIKSAIEAVLASISGRLESDLPSPIDLDTSDTDSSDSDLPSPIDLDTSDTDSSDSDLPSPIDLDTSDTDSSDSDLPSPIALDTSDTDSSDSDLQYLIEIDTYPSEIDTYPIEINTYPSEIDTYPIEINTYPIEIDTYPSEIDTFVYPSEIDTHPIKIDTDPIKIDTDPIKIDPHPIKIDTDPIKINTHPIKIDTYPSEIDTYPIKIDPHPIKIDTDPSEIDTHPIKIDPHPIKIDTDPSEIDTHPIKIDTDPIKIDTYPSEIDTYPSEIDTDPSEIDTDPSEIDTYPSEIDTYPSEIDTYPSEIDTSDTDSSDSDLPSPSEIDTSDTDSSDSDLPSPIDLDLDAAMASIDERLERYRESTGTYLLSDDIDSDFRAEIKRDMEAVMAGIGARLEKIENDILNPPIVSDSSGSDSDLDDSDDEGEDPDPQGTKKFKHLWVLCENETCEMLNYKSLLKERLNICEFCGYHLKMNSSDRIELSIDPDTWHPMDEDLFSLDPIEWHSKKHRYKDRIASDQRKTGLTEAIQTGRGKLNGIPVAIGVMDFRFVGGSMGSVVGEKITRLIEYATHRLLPLIIVCASGGARMQEGSLSLMQMAKISCALHEYQSNKQLFYVSILASPTTGGVLASFGMLGDIIIAEPNAYIAFAGKRVIEQTLNIILPEGSQETENLFEKGLFDLIVPRKPLKSVLSELLKFHAFFPWNEKRPLLLPLNATLEHN
uniref:Acetyl-coenzyme A carboxylase carboxyl transferase subunit beta, chloroplastic n=1 Tax=Ligustrum japonicum TaxID=46072 RepID=A0A4D5Y933_LIGJA|nr:acetyl-CoA carboxylase beta subunit [Ligustrum japonicum]QBS52300.1 acetyl-CoA carboxylase beta subunit [Ligustrum japonicum]